MVDRMSIRAIIAEDNLLVREGVRRLLDLQADIEIVAACQDLDALLAAVERERPDVVITDIRMPPDGRDEGLQAADRLRDTHPETGVIVLSQWYGRLRQRPRHRTRRPPRGHRPQPGGAHVRPLKAPDAASRHPPAGPAGAAVPRGRPRRPGSRA